MTEPLHDIHALNAFNATVVEEFRANGGNVGDQFEGADLLLLTTTGAKSGRRRLNPLQYSRVDGAIIVVGAFAGADVNPAWVHNLRANPRAHATRPQVDSAVLTAWPGSGLQKCETSTAFCSPRFPHSWTAGRRGGRGCRPGR